MDLKDKKKLLRIIKANNNGGLLSPFDYVHVNLCLNDFPEETKIIYAQNKLNKECG